MKKSLLAIALMIGAATFVSSCGGDGKKDKTYTCQCKDSGGNVKEERAGLDEAAKAAFESECAKGGYAKEVYQASCK
jgi:hypothetical protein